VDVIVNGQPTPVGVFHVVRHLHGPSRRGDGGAGTPRTKRM
jgi:hypothetical protein